MTDDDIVEIGKTFHAAFLGKVIEVPWLYCYGADDNSHDLEGPFKVVVDPSGMPRDLEEFQCGYYDPNWSVTPLPGQDIPEGSRTFWCTPVSCEVATGKWDVSFRVVKEPQLSAPTRFRVDMSGLALMRGSIEVEAEDKKRAEEEALAHTGDVHWNYEGMDDETIEVSSVEPCR